MHIIKETAKALVAKLGFQTNRRIVVFESDDWGAVRVPDSDALAAFENRFPSFRLDHYQSFDGLEKKADVSTLSSLLRENAVRFRASAPVFTLNFATANPDFNRCVPGNADVAHFGFEPIDKTYRTYDGDEGVLDFVRLGCGETALHPQLHGREHLNATAWLADTATDPAVEYARGLRMVGLDDAFYNGIDALNIGNTLIDVSEYLEDAVAIFKRLFGFTPRSFIPPCYVANKECERIAAGLGIETIQSSPKRNVPKGNDSYLKKINVFGNSNVPGQCRLIRNVQFEPSRSMFQGKSVDECVDAAFAEIETAFRRRQPAVVCTHRVNYTTRVNDRHREFSLEALDGLLRRLAELYPDCEFMTSDELGSLILDLRRETKWSMMHFSPKLLRDKIRGNEFWAKLAKNVFTIVVGQGGASALNMLTSFISAGFLGVAGYGSLMIGQTYMQAIDSLLNFQSWQSVIRYGSISLEKRDEHGLAACIKAAFLVDVISAVAGCVISFAIVGLVAGVLGWDSAATAAAVVFCFEILVHIEGAPTGLLRLFDRFNYVAIHAVVMAAVKLLFVAASMVLFWNNVVVIACAYCAADVIKSLTLFFIAVHVARRRVGLFKIVKARLADLPAGYISFTIWSNLDTSADAPIQYFDVFFLSLLSSEVVGVFKFFRQLLSALSLLSRPVQQAIMPQLAELIAKGLNNRAYEVVRKIEKVVAKVVTPCAAIACLVVPPALAVFMDPLYGAYWYLFATLAALVAASIVFSAIHPCFNAYGLTKQSTVITLISNVVYLVVSYLLLGKLGVMAIPLAMALQYLIVIGLKDIYIRKVILD